MAHHTTVLVAGLGIVSLACASASYRPTVPMKSRSGNLQLELEKVRVGPGEEFFLRSHSTAPHLLRQAWLTTPTRVPCSGGHEVTIIYIDGEDTPSLSPGTHQIRASFAPPMEDLHQDLVLDLTLGEGGCARTPAMSQSLPMEAPRRLVLLGSYGLEGNQTLRGVEATHALRLGAGGWLGPVLLSAEAGIGGSICEYSTCGREGEKGKKSGLGFPVAADARYAFAPALRGAVLGVPFLGVRYSFLPVSVPALAGTRHLGLHGFHAILGYGISITWTTNGPFRHAERTPLVEVYVPLGVMVDPGGPTRRVGFSGGMGVRALFPL